jgi:hypothetical protein
MAKKVGTENGYEDDLLDEMKKYKISSTKMVSTTLPYHCKKGTSAKDWLEIINEFLSQNKLEDASIYVENEDGYASITISSDVRKTEEEIRSEIDWRKTLEAEKAKQKRERRKLRKQEELRLFARLSKKFGSIKGG